MPIEYQNDRIDTLDQNSIEDIRRLIGCRIPHVNIALVMLLLNTIFVGLDVFDFLDNSICFGAAYFMHGWPLMFVSVD
jgi:hypothetical protein